MMRGLAQTLVPALRAKLLKLFLAATVAMPVAAGLAKGLLGHLLLRHFVVGGSR